VLLEELLDELDAAGGGLLVLSLVDGFCAKATLVSKAEAARPAVIYFINMCVLLI